MVLEGCQSCDHWLIVKGVINEQKKDSYGTLAHSCHPLYYDFTHCYIMLVESTITLIDTYNVLREPYFLLITSTETSIALTECYHMLSQTYVMLIECYHSLQTLVTLIKT